MKQNSSKHSSQSIPYFHYCEEGKHYHLVEDEGYPSPPFGSVEAGLFILFYVFLQYEKQDVAVMHKLVMSLFETAGLKSSSSSKKKRKKKNDTETLSLFRLDWESRAMEHWGSFFGQRNPNSQRVFNSGFGHV